MGAGRQMREALVEILEEVPGLLGRVYYALAPARATAPFLVLHTVGGQGDHVHGSATVGKSDRVQIDHHADGPTAAQDLADDVAAAIDGAGNFERGGTHFAAILRQGTELDQSAPDLDTDTQRGRHRKVIDYLILWQPAASL